MRFAYVLLANTVKELELKDRKEQLLMKQLRHF